MRSRRTWRTRNGLSPALGLLLLSALWAFGSLRAELFPAFGIDTLSPAARQAVVLSVFAALAASAAWVRRVENGPRNPDTRSAQG